MMPSEALYSFGDGDADYHVSEHAALRFIERVIKPNRKTVQNDISKIKRLIYDDVKKGIEISEIGKLKYYMKNYNCIAVIENNRVVTILV